MNETIEVRTQAELDKALKKADPSDVIVLVGDGYFELSGTSGASGSSQVTAYDSSQVRAYGSSQVTAYGSSQVTAYDSSQVTASGSSQVTASGSSQVTASKYVAVTKQASRVKVDGGVLIELPEITTAAEWCEFHGVAVDDDGLVVLFKAVNDDYASHWNGFLYTPGSSPEAPDWDGGTKECGGGLHFAPSPHHAAGFDPTATRFVACPVRLDEIVVHRDSQYPQKVKAPRVGAPCFEVDIHGVVVSDSAVAL